MRNKIKFFLKISTLFTLLVFSAVPLMMSADTINGAPASSQLVPCGGPTDPCTLCHLIVGIHNIVQYGFYWVITFALVGLFISGIIYMISSGDEGRITKAKGFMRACLIGFVIVAGAWMIVNTTMRVLSAKEAGDTGGTLGIGIVNWYTFTCDTTTNQGVVPITP